MAPLYLRALRRRSGNWPSLSLVTGFRPTLRMPKTKAKLAVGGRYNTAPEAFFAWRVTIIDEREETI